MNVLIVYNVDANNELKKKIVEEFKEQGYNNSWLDSNRQRTFLPPNTLWKKDIDLKAPLQELKVILAKLNIPESKILNCIIVPASPWNSIPGVEVEL